MQPTPPTHAHTTDMHLTHSHALTHTFSRPNLRLYLNVQAIAEDSQKASTALVPVFSVFRLPDGDVTIVFRVHRMILSNENLTWDCKECRQ